MSARWLLCWILCLSAQACEIALVSVGDTWRYYKGIRPPSDSGNPWTELDFDDSKWLAGPTGLGYGTGVVATYLEDMGVSPYLSVFCRRVFLVDNPEAIRWLVLRLDYQDGFVAYLNGREIARRGFEGAPNTPVSFEALPMRHDAGAAEEIEVSGGALVAGANVLSIQVHRFTVQGRGVALAPELLANFTRGPLVQNLSTNRVQIIWKTPVPASTIVEYSPAVSSRPIRYVDQEPVTTHVATLTNLSPDTLYDYRIRSDDGHQQATGPLLSFRTFKLKGSLRLAVAADTGLGTVEQYQIAQVLAATEADLVMIVGDVLYPSFTAGLVDLKCFSVYRQQMAQVPFFFAIGNHDRYANSTDYAASFYLPTNAVTGSEYFYSFDHGEAHLVVLDTDLRVGNSFAPGSPQYQWLEADLAQTRKSWKLLFFHNPPRSSGPHRYDDYNLNGVSDRFELQQTIGFLAAQYGVQVIFNGHDHLYERLNPVHGTHVIVTGGGGGGLYQFGGTRDETSSQLSSRYECVSVAVHSEALELEALDQNGFVFDRLFIQRTPPTNRVYEATWHTPAVEPPSSDPVSVNLDGQVFDFQGQPIPAVCGLSANLGRLYVNNNASTLYLGLEQCLIGDTDVVVVFVESPHLPGVGSGWELRPGPSPPLPSGAQGLRFLEGLVFTNWTPSIGCLLGDERADRIDRNFNRNPGFGPPTGQGVFYLNAALENVPGVLLQQFNRSPQASNVYEEYNANFIELAIPFSQLGDLKPGEVIKVGAVVARGALTMQPGQPPFLLDDGFLGLAARNTAPNAMLLEGVSVRLAASTDEDGDGLPDAWEEASGLSASTAAGIYGSAGDPDEDGLSNGEEFLAGTNPRDPLSGLRLHIEPVGPYRLQLSWMTVPGKRYWIEYTKNRQLNADAWQILAPPRLARGGTQSILDENQRGQDRFYRLRVGP